MTQKHTPTPWKWTEGGFMRLVGADHREDIIWYTTDEDGLHGNAADKDYIIRCVNAHAALVEALETVRERMNCPNCDEGLCEDCSERFGDVWPIVQAALKQARGE